jgi:hypothetical protein
MKHLVEFIVLLLVLAIFALLDIGTEFILFPHQIFAFLLELTPVLLEFGKLLVRFVHDSSQILVLLLLVAQLLSKGVVLLLLLLEVLV